MLAAFESDGSHRWSMLGGAGKVTELAASNTLLACVGYSTATVNIGGGDLTSAGGNDVFLGALTPSSTDLCLAAFNSAGVHQWRWIRAGTFSPGVGILMEVDVAVSAAGVIALAGQFQGSTNLGGGVLNSAGSNDVFLAKYDAAGAHLASEAFGRSSSDGAQGLSWDGAGNLALAGNFLSPVIDIRGGAVASTGFFLASLEGATTPTASLSLPTGLRLAQNAPNPFNPHTVIQFSLEHDAHVQLEIFDAAGRRVRILASSTLPAGQHQFVFDGRDDDGGSLASGVFRYRLRSGLQTRVRSMVLVR